MNGFVLKNIDTEYIINSEWHNYTGYRMFNSLFLVLCESILLIII